MCYHFGMKLLYSPTSPYVRKVRVVAREKTLQDRIEEIQKLPADSPPELLAANPLGKVPAFIMEDGTSLYDSPVICEYLDSLAPEPQLFPDDDSRWAALRLQALADGIMDVAVAAVMEQRRPEHEQSASAVAHWHEQIRAGVKESVRQLELLPATISIGHIALAVALSYLDFRHHDLQWRQYSNMAMIDWHDAYCSRPSMQATEPPA